MFPDNIALPDGFHNVEAYSEYLGVKINQMIGSGFNKEQAVDHLSKIFLINPEHTRTAWDYYADMYLSDQATPPNVQIDDSLKEPIVGEENARKKRKTQDSATMDSGEILEKILTAVNKIESTSEQMLKLMTDAASKSGEKQQAEEEKEQAENLENQAGKDSTK